jgi:hypothetical protein
MQTLLWEELVENPDMILSIWLEDMYSQSSKSKHYVKAYFLLPLQL